ncbi:hypothetical protein CQA74_28320, partial [Escherichia coli]
MTLAAITMTAPEAASPVQMYRATYSPDDNKLRLYAVSRLDPETYKKVHDAGFRGTVAKLAMRQPFVLFKGLTFQKLCLPGAFRPG